jgi:hypothetical protein
MAAPNYTANGQSFTSFSAAVVEAKTASCEVFEEGTGKRRWHPAPSVSVASMRRYNRRKAAYEAQERRNARR